MLLNGPIFCPKRCAVEGDTGDKKDAGAAGGGTGSSEESAKTPATAPAGSPKQSTLLGAPLATIGTAASTAASNAASTAKAGISAVEKMILEDEAEEKKVDRVVVPVFKVAVRFVKANLWKDEVRLNVHHPPTRRDYPCFPSRGSCFAISWKLKFSHGCWLSTCLLFGSALPVSLCSDVRGRSRAILLGAFGGWA